LHEFSVGTESPSMCGRSRDLYEVIVMTSEIPVDQWKKLVGRRSTDDG